MVFIMCDLSPAWKGTHNQYRDNLPEKQHAIVIPSNVLEREGGIGLSPLGAVAEDRPRLHVYMFYFPSLRSTLFV